MSATPEIPNRKLIYEDDLVQAYADFYDKSGKVVIHSVLYDPNSTKTLKRAKEVSDDIDLVFKQKGVDFLHTWSLTPEQGRYCNFLGYTETGYDILTADGSRYTEYVKAL